MNVLQAEPAPHKRWLPLILITFLTLAIFIVSIISLVSGWVTIFQNLFYFPIILACAYYVKRGFVFSVLLACAYFVLIGIFSNDTLVLEGALVRVVIFILVAGMITYLSMVRIRAEEIALNTRSNFEVFFNTIDDFLYVLDEQGNILHTNETVIRRLGYTKKEVLSQPVLKMSKPGISENEEKTVQEKLSGTCDFYSPLPLVNKEGRLIPVETRVTRGEWNGKPVLFVVRKDISQLKLSEEKFSTAFHLNASLMALATKTDRKFIEVNRTFLKTLGFSRDEVIGKTANDLNIFVNPQTENDILADLEALGIVKNTEVQIRKKDGRTRTVLFSVDRIRVGIEHCLLSTFNDITELKQSESALHESEEKYRSLIENSHEIIYTLTTRGIFTFVSPSWTIQLGHPVTQVVGRAFTQFVHPDDIAICWVFMQNVIETGQRQTGVEYRVLHSDGTWRWHSTGAVPLRNDAGTIVAFEGCASDITERKKAEEAMLESEGRFRTLLQHVPSVSVQGYKMDGMTQYWNDASQILYGYTSEEAIGKNIVDLIIPPEMQEGVRQACGLMAETGQPIPASELSLMRKDGSMVSVFSSHAIIKRPGGEMELFCIDIDLTGRKLAEDTLLRVNQKLNILSELTRKNLSTQIFILNSYLKLAKKQARGQDQVIETLKKGEQAALAINEITEITRDYQDMGIYPPKWQNVKIVFLLGLSHITTSNVRHSIETENLEIFADPLLEKAFQGLFENSLKHGDHVNRIRVWYTTSPYGATVIFEDDGTGIPHEQKESVFLRIEGRKAQVRGLFFIREILDITGITIQETGKPGKGARFEITVPVGKWRF